MTSSDSAFEIRARVGFRILREDDAPALEWHGGENLRGWYREQWQRHARGEIAVVVADFNGFPIGQGAIHWHGKPTHPQIPDIQSLRVFAAFRSFGVGSRLLQACENAVRERGFPHVSLAVAIENTRAQKLYERCGYHPSGATYDDQWHYIDARGVVVHNVEHVQDLIKIL